MIKVSVIIPVFNEEKDIANCLSSLKEQTLKNEIEVLVVDDGSSDNTFKILEDCKNFKLKILKQNHLGAAAARNLGAKEANGEILVFVDADMTFENDFLEKLIEPIIKGQVNGTFSKDEYVSNKNNVWSKCWNINKNLPFNKMHDDNYPNTQRVFRAILKREFEKAGGFDSIGYIDDHTLSEKVGFMAINVPGAVFYHKNPESLDEVFRQARWIGKSEFKRRKIKNELIMKLISIIRYSLPFSIFHGVYKSIKFNLNQFFIFKVIYDLGIEISLIGSFFGEQKYR